MRLYFPQYSFRLNITHQFCNPFLFICSFCYFCQKKLKLRLISFIPAIVWLAISFKLLTMPAEEFPKEDFFDLIYFDKWIHIGMFALLMVLFSYPFLKTQKGIRTIFYVIMLLCITYGVSMEFVQKYFIPSRSFDFLDIVADLVGSYVGYLFLKYQLRKIKVSA